MTLGARAQALEGLRVIEFGAFAAGPAIGKHAANHGAQVIHVETRTRVDGFRMNYPPFKDNQPGLERAAQFAMTNDCKLGITLNLKADEGRSLALRLIAVSDVVIENFPPGTMKRLGLEYDILSEVNPRLVMLSTCNQGQTGPHAKHPGFGTQLTAMSGFIHFTGWPDREPSLLWGPYIDYIAVAYGLVAVLAALGQRLRTGRGCHIDLSQYETGLQLLAPALVEYSTTGATSERDGNHDRLAVPHGVYPCMGDERWVAISVHDDSEWHRLRSAMGDPEWAQPEALGSVSGRRSTEAELDLAIADWTRTLARDEVVACLREARIHVAPVNDMADIFDDGQLNSMRIWRQLEHPQIGRMSFQGPAFLLSDTPAVIDRPAPLLGQHNREVFCGTLGLTDAEYERLERAGVFD